VTDLTILSLGAGVQSTTLYWMACEGEFENVPDYAIFADTQREPPWVYDALERMENLGSIPVLKPTHGDIGDSVTSAVKGVGRFASIPFWVEGEDGREAPGRRQCTREYKIDVVKGEIRRLLGLKTRQWAKGKFHVEEWVGISVDEAHRAKPSRADWITSRWPLLERHMRRSECKRWLADNGHPIPGKSACIFCPYRNAKEWQRWREDHPELFEEACQWDEKIRASGTLRGMSSEQFIWRALRPLRELDKTVDPDPALDLFGNECEGMCGV
jgi:hypothetical protein